MAGAFGRYLYWTNFAPLRKGADTIGRARLDGADVNQRFIANKDFINLQAWP